MIWLCQAMPGLRAADDVRETTTIAIGSCCWESASSIRSDPSLDKVMNMVLRQFPVANCEMSANVDGLERRDSNEKVDGKGSIMNDAMRLK